MRDDSVIIVLCCWWVTWPLLFNFAWYGEMSAWNSTEIRLLNYVNWFPFVLCYLGELTVLNSLDILEVFILFYIDMRQTYKELYKIYILYCPCRSNFHTNHLILKKWHFVSTLSFIAVAVVTFWFCDKCCYQVCTDLVSWRMWFYRIPHKSLFYIDFDFNGVLLIIGMYKSVLNVQCW